MRLARPAITIAITTDCSTILRKAVLRKCRNVHHRKDTGYHYGKNTRLPKPIREPTTSSESHAEASKNDIAIVVSEQQYT
jgi:hypothetical protein